MMSRNGLARRPLWLIARHQNNRMEVLGIKPGDGGALPVFSFEEEAELFLRLEAPETGWRVRRTTAGELISVLYGVCAGVEKVALDPPPEIAGKAMLDLVSLSRKDFVRTLVDGEGPAEPGRSPLLASFSYAPA